MGLVPADPGQDGIAACRRRVLEVARAGLFPAVRFRRQAHVPTWPTSWRTRSSPTRRTSGVRSAGSGGGCRCRTWCRATSVREGIGPDSTLGRTDVLLRAAGLPGRVVVEVGGPDEVDVAARAARQDGSACARRRLRR
ncbi:hypothetical protein ACIGNX_22480 [Actinosynnema sp. NPDC053489]|uniref:hypothetical protein n=1 Tax=Actinosynnema sp. NPDC053489 TaxID=3363916 RepID=UPI0037C9FB51